MIKLTVIYPKTEGGRFDMDYYINRHMANFDGDALVRGIIVEKGSEALGGGEAPYICMAHVFYDTMEDFQKSFIAIRNVLRDDMKNFTNISSIDQISEVVSCDMVKP